MRFCDQLYFEKYVFKYNFILLYISHNIFS